MKVFKIVVHKYVAFDKVLTFPDVPLHEQSPFWQKYQECVRKSSSTLTAEIKAKGGSNHEKF